MRTIKTDISENTLDAVKSTVSIRPNYLNEYIGQENIKKNLQTAIRAAKIKNTSLGHMLFFGPPGLGKTTISAIIANEMGSRLKTVSGPAIERQGELAAILSSLGENDILFIDEIHRLPKAVEEILYSAMEDYKIDIIVGADQQTKTVTLDLAHFTLIGATTRAGLISNPLRDRFHMVFNMEYYNEKELTQIIKRTALLYGYELDDAAASIIANVSRETPRIANNLTKRITDYLIANEKLPKEKYIRQALKEIGYDEKGFTSTESKYIQCLELNKEKPTGLKTLSAYMGESIDTIAESIEPFLIRKGYILVTPKGRMLTSALLEDKHE